MANEDTVVLRLGVTPEQLIGYAYAGLLAALVTAIIQPPLVTGLIASLGGVLSTIVAVALGVGIYVLYFKLLGEFILYPFHHLVHWGLDRIRGKTGLERTSCVGYLGSLGVSIGQRRAAYETVKAMFFRERERRRIQLAHGELHVLYLTATELMAAAIYLHISGRPSTLWYGLSAVSYLAALVADLRQHTLECTLLKSYADLEVRKFLASAGYVKILASPEAAVLQAPETPGLQAITIQPGPSDASRLTVIAPINGHADGDG